MSRLIAALLLLQLARPAALAGQAPAQATLLRPGARVRITQAGENPRVAILVAQTDDSLVVEGPKFEGDEAIPLRQISQLEVSTGRHRNVLKGMAMGAGIGGTAGLLLGAVTYSPCTGWCIMGPSDRGESAALGGAVFGTLGLVIGTLVGVASHDSWKRVPLDERRVALAVVPRARGTGLGATLRF